MPRKPKVILFAGALAATALALLAIVELGLIEQVSYSVEKGRLRALRDTLSSSPRLAQSSRVNRAVADLVIPGVVSIETDYIAGEPGSSDGGGGDSQAAEPSPNPQDPQSSNEPETQEEAAGGDPNTPLPARQSVGSGFCFDAAKGYILTNAHVVDGAKNVRVFLHDGRSADAVVLGVDLDSDLAALRIDLTRLHELPMGNSEEVAVGDEVFAVGNPYGLEGTVSKGIISAVNRRNVQVDGGASYRSLIQTDAAISPGSSGGPLVDLRGEVIGITSAFIADSESYDGVGFAIPSSEAVKLIPDLIEGGPAYLGVLVWSASDPDWHATLKALGWTDRYGAVVERTYPDTGADRAGLKKDDVILSIDGVRIDDIERLGNVLSGLEAGTRIELGLWREGQAMTLQADLGRRYAPR